MLQSPDLRLIEILWQDLKSAVHKQMATNLNDLKQQCRLKLLHSNVRGWLSQIENSYLKLLLLQVVLQATESRGVFSFHRTAKSAVETFFSHDYIFVGLPSIRI